MKELVVLINCVNCGEAANSTSGKLFGLSPCSKFAESIDGKLTLAVRMDQGARFVLLFSNESAIRHPAK